MMKKLPKNSGQFFDLSNNSNFDTNFRYSDISLEYLSA